MRSRKVSFVCFRTIRSTVAEHGAGNVIDLQDAGVPPESEREAVADPVRAEARERAEDVQQQVGSEMGVPMRGQVRPRSEDDELELKHGLRRPRIEHDVHDELGLDGNRPQLPRASLSSTQFGQCRYSSCARHATRRTETTQGSEASDSCQR